VKPLIAKLTAYIRQNKQECLLVVGLLILSAVTHAWNMFHFPYFENDEATYISQAWSFISDGRLAPYTYWYDHAPVGWMFLGLWHLITGGFSLFELLLHSGRVFMLLLHVASSLLLYVVTKRLSGNRLAAAVAVLIFSLSPLAIYFQRRVLLDNIMVFWILLAIFFTLIRGSKLSNFVYSAIAFAIAVLTKENAIFLAPAMLYLVAKRSHPHQRKYALTQWILVVATLISLYFIYALLKSELFPAGSLLGGNSNHVSLLETLKQQNSRGSFAWPWQPASDFYQNLRGWLHRDPLVIGAGMLTTIIGLLLSIKYKVLRASSFMAAMFWLFLARGKLVIEFYIAPIIPLLAVNIGMFVAAPLKKLPRPGMRSVYAWSVIAVVLVAYTQVGTAQYTRDETTNQIKAIEWIKQNIPNESYMAIDDYPFAELKANGGFPNAEWSWKVSHDPEIKQKFNNDWRNIEYILLTHEVLKQIKTNNFPLIGQALDNGVLVADFTAGSTSYIDIKERLSTNGDWAQVYKVRPKNEAVLQRSWEAYKAKFILPDGRVVDPQRGDITTSEGQAYAMLRAIYLGDRQTFDKLWQWSSTHIARPQDKLLAWKWENGQVSDLNTASDGDEDVALSLLEATTAWNEQSYLEAARPIINDLWEKTVTKVGNKYILKPAASGFNRYGQVINPSYIAPYHYKQFAKVDPVHPWQELVDSSYQQLSQIQSPVGLFSDWASINKDGAVESGATEMGEGAVNSGYEAFRVNWRLGLDAIRTQDQRAKDLLEKSANFYYQQWQTNNRLSAIYKPDGTAATPNEDLTTYAGAVIALRAIGQEQQALDIYNQAVASKYNESTGTWGDADNYYNQNWAWFGAQTVLGRHYKQVP